MSLSYNPESLYGSALRLSTEDLSLGTHYFCAVLKHYKTPRDNLEESDFVWIKCKGVHTIDKLRGAYEAQTHPAEDVFIHFNLNNAYPNPSLAIQALDQRGSHIVVFWAFPSPNPNPPLDRQPLQPVNSHFAAQPQPSTPLAPRVVKPEPGLVYGMGENMMPAQQNSPYHPAASGFQQAMPHRSTPNIKEDDDSEAGDDDPFENPFEEEQDDTPRESRASKQSRLNELLDTASPEVLESEVKKGMKLLQKLATPLKEQLEQCEDAPQWLKQIETLQKVSVTAPTIIGVVGATGAGKSSVINALLDEEKLLPTNCMRACTAVVTELSWNSSENENQKYRGEIEFIKPEEWEKELKLLFNELLDDNGHVSRECTNADTEAGVAYAKIKAVYPLLTKDEMASSSAEKLMRLPHVRDILGTTKTIARGNSLSFYAQLQRFLDSKEKTPEKNDKEKKENKSSMEYWPLIKVVRIYTKAHALSTGAVIVDLPGVQDQNAARSAVAKNYLKNCTGLWIVAPITRAVDDKTAKSLMGDSFKRQLKFDGKYSKITFICSKTDDISITEAIEGLGIQDQTQELFDKSDDLATQRKKLQEEIKGLKETKAVYHEVYEDADDQIEIWEDLQEKLDDGKRVYAPLKKSDTSNKKKRKQSKSPRKQPKKKRKVVLSDSDDDFDAVTADSDAEESDQEEADEGREPLTENEITSKIEELKATKKDARKEKAVAIAKLSEANGKLKEIKSQMEDVDAQMMAKCISGRNTYSKQAIRQDFATGIKELDQENAIEEDEANFNPAEDIRDYDAVAKALPVFCVSSRGYQNLSGRLLRDKNATGFTETEATEIPQLQAHCTKLTEDCRASNCRTFLNNLSQLTNSLTLWATNDGTGMNLTDEEKDAEARNLAKKLDTLSNGFDKCISNCIKKNKEVFKEYIYDQFDDLIRKAEHNAVARADFWGSPVNKYDRSNGGYHFMTYRAIVRRSGGPYTNAHGNHDWNEQFCEPIMKDLASNWEKVFVRRVPSILTGFAREAKDLLNKFHAEIEKRSLQKGVGIAGMALLKQQLETFFNTFQEASRAANELILEHSREANRGFLPVILEEMNPTYQAVGDERGPGCYKRMKAVMKEDLEEKKHTMFRNSTDSVKDQLKGAIRDAESSLSDVMDVVNTSVRRDYMQVVGGRNVSGQVMPRAERQLRQTISKVLDEGVKDEEVEEVEKVEESSNDDDDLAGNQLKNDDDQASEQTDSEDESEKASEVNDDAMSLDDE